MNPFTYVLSTMPIGSSGNVEASAILAVLQLREEAYSSGFTRGPGNSEWDFVIRDLHTRFGDTPLVVYLARMFAPYLGKS